MRAWLSSSDAGWLHMEEPCNLMMIGGLLELSAVLPRQQLQDCLESRLLVHERFRMRVEDSLGRPHWCPCPVNWVHHLRYEILPSSAQLMGRVSQLMSESLPRDRPLWQFHVLEYDGRCAMLARLHHAMGDGVGLMRVLLGLTDAADQEAIRPRAHPPRLGAWYRGLMRLLRLLFSGADPNTPLKGKLGPEKRVVRSRAYSLPELKTRAARLNLTLNDLMMAALTEAIQLYLLERGYDPSGHPLRAVVPVDMRRAGEEGPGNRFGLVFLHLPVNLLDWRARLKWLKQHLDELKSSPEPAAIYALIRLVGLLPAWVEHGLVSLFGSKATLVATNLPGPRQPCRLAGVTMERMVYWVPMSGRLGLGVSFLSYADQLEMGVASDAHLVPDPERIVVLFEEACERLGAADPAQA